MRFLLQLLARALLCRLSFVILHSAFVLLLLPVRAAEPFEIKDGDRVLFLGDTLLEREGTYGYLETRMVEQFPDRKFTVRNLAFSADTPLGWSRASFDPPAKGFERLKEQLALVKPTVVFLGYGMAASLQEMTDRSQDWTLNRDPARYGAEPMSAARFKKELAQCMDAIQESGVRSQESGKTPAANLTPDSRPLTPAPVRFVLLSPIRHEDLRVLFNPRPGLPDPTEHNKLLEQYTRAIEELAKERGARFVPPPVWGYEKEPVEKRATWHARTENGIHMDAPSYWLYGMSTFGPALGWVPPDPPPQTEFNVAGVIRPDPLRAAIIRKNALFFHRWRPANETYLFGFRKGEQGKNGAEIPMFDPLIEKAEAEIERLKKAPKGASIAPPDGGAAIRIQPSEPPKLTRAFRNSTGATGNPIGAIEDSTRAIGNPTRAIQDPTHATGDCIHANGNSTHATGDCIHANEDSTHATGDCIHANGNSTHATGDCIHANEDCMGLPVAEMAEIRPKMPVFADNGQFYPVNDPQPPGNQPSDTPAAPARQTPAEKPDLSKLVASPSTLPLPSFTLADGLEITLWAENPLLAKPTQCNWDAQGRLWVASSALYPQIAPGQEASDKIIILEDPDRTGKATKSTVFADGLLIPTGVAPVLVSGSSSLVSGKNQPPATSNQQPAAPRFACYVGQSTELLYFEDTDGDGKADKKRIVLSGFGTEDTHHNIHTLRWGPDGRLYFNQSVYTHSHMETPWGVVRLNSGGVLAYDPRTERVEVFCKGLWNPWGHAWDQWGQSFLTDGAGASGISWAFPGAVFGPSEGARRTMRSISPGSYPKFCGLELIYSPHFPADWQGTAVTCDFRAHKVVHFKINDLASQGKSGYVTDQLPVLVQTSEAAFRPIDVKLGPDGALYIADWSNPIINHGEVDFRDPRRDHEHGRIWRVNWKSVAAVKWESLVGKKTEELPEKLLSGNLWVKEQARAILSQRLSEPNEAGECPAPSKIQPIEKWREQSTSAMAAFEAFRVYGALQPDNISAVRWFEFVRTVVGSKLMAEANASLRSIGIRLSFAADQTRVHYSGPGSMEQYAAKTDSNPRVRIEAMRALARVSSIHSADGILDAAINAPKDDPFYDFAAWRSVNDLAPQVAAWVEEKAKVADSGAPKTMDELDRFEESVRETNKENAARRKRIAELTEAIEAAVKAGNRYDVARMKVEVEKIESEMEALPNSRVLADTALHLEADRDAKISLALQSLPPDTTGPLLSKLITKGSILLDGSGPWIELIGNTGGPGELRILLDGLLAATKPEEKNGKPLANSKWKFKTPDANRRAAAALVVAARRGVKPAGDAAGQLASYQFYMYAPADALPDVLRLAGLWKQDFPHAIAAAIAGPTEAPVLDAAFEALRTLGTPAAADFLNAFLEPRQGKRDEGRYISVAQALKYNDGTIRRRALTALASLRPAEAMKHLPSVLHETPEADQQRLWRELFASAPFLKQFTGATMDLPSTSYAPALRAARELGGRGKALVAMLAPFAGEKAATGKTAPANYADLAARAKKDGDPVAGEALYRRAASACVTCHAIGGAGGKLGPDLTSIGASAPLDYIIESVLDPAAKVKEGYHAFTFKMKDGSEAVGIPSRETATEQFIRTIAGEQPLSKADIVTKKIAEGGASLMPAGLTAAWTGRERLNLYAFLGELGRPGPFDAGKNNVARVWQLTDAGKVDGALKPEPASAVTFLLNVYTLVDGRLTKDLLAEKLAMLPTKKDAVHLTARFQAATEGKAKFSFTGVSKAWLDGQPLAVASEPSPLIELTAGEHALTVEVDAKSPPDVVRAASDAVTFLGD